MGFGHLFPSSYCSPDTESAPQMDCGMSKCTENLHIYSAKMFSEPSMCHARTDTEEAEPQCSSWGGQSRWLSDRQKQNMNVTLGRSQSNVG